jgi:hypothetical protein
VTECNEECEQTGAAIFCGGQYLVSSGDLQACADELSADFSISIDVDIDVDVDVDVDDTGADDDDDGVDLDGDGDPDASCSVAPGNHVGSLGHGLLFMLGFGATRIRRR